LCNAAKAERKRRKQQNDREDARSVKVAAIQERAGDMASIYHLYGDAAHYYQEVLKASPPPAVLERITEKIADALFFDGDLKAANLHYERLLSMSIANPQNAAKCLEVLFRIVSQLTLDCEGEGVLATLMRARTLAETSGDPTLIRLAQLRRVEALQHLGRYREAENALTECGQVAVDDSVLAGYFIAAHALSAGALGQAGRAYEYFETALDLTKKSMDPYGLTLTWNRYGYTAQQLGDTIRAKNCYEQALFIAMRHRITYMVAQAGLNYAQHLNYMGQSAAAHASLVDALSSGPVVPYVALNSACVGIPIALQVGDEKSLAQCAQPKAIDLAFRSSITEFIGGVGCSFAELYMRKGRPRAARALLRRAMEKIPYAQNNLDVLISVAQYGGVAEIERARLLLEQRISLPRAELFVAGLEMFNGFVENRQGRKDSARQHALNAAEKFGALQLHGYSHVARAIVGDSAIAPKRRPSANKPFSQLQPTLTPREREVAALVLRGFTNREIAQELHIALHTVEKHMNSLMNRLGVRSRYQVADLLESWQA
jgi:ATP/maltotriose-dependent transcriptional regulator MalT